MIGGYSKTRAEKAGHPFEPEKSGYGGRENPLGKRFEGIIRFVSPVFENGSKIGYVTLALDHQHVMNFTDYVLPKQGAFEGEISDAAIGNYAFMWDQHARSISHPRDYFIVGFDPETGHRKPGWISADIAEKWKASGVSDLREFLQTYPKFEEQSLNKKPNIAQIKEGYISLDCRYLNFAPQCHGWNQLNGTGGGGSFVIFWSKVWKLTTVATIPYFTGQYDTQRGFGFITIGANVDEFHLAATKTKESIDGIVEEETTRLEQTIESSRQSILGNIQKVIREISVSTAVLTLLAILVAIWISNYLTNRIRTLMKATNAISKGNLDYRIKARSQDELGVLSNSVDKMAETLEKNSKELKDYSDNLEQKVESKTRDIKTILHSIKQGIFTFSENYLVHAEYSQHLEEIFEVAKLTNVNVLDLIFKDSNISDDEAARVKSVIETTIDCMEYAFYCNAHLFPKDVVKVVNGSEKNLEIYWDPILSTDGYVEKIMAVVRDVTELKALEQENLAKEREMVMMGQVVEVGMDHFHLFHGNTTDHLGISQQLLKAGLGKEDKKGLEELERYIHTIKGNARTFNLSYLVDLLHQLEQDILGIKQGAEQTDFSSVGAQVEECKNVLEEYHKITEKFFVKESGSHSAHQVIETISRELKSVDLGNDSGKKVTAFNNIAKAYYQTQFVSLEELIMPNLQSLPRIADAVNKPEPTYKIEDGGIRFSNKLSKLFDAVFVHLLRNSMDHGIEAPELRTTSGIDSEGHISIEVLEGSDRFVTIHYSDDGKGLNRSFHKVAPY
ncbi:MAG: HAMP domain-containing protein [Oligoflexales bacterium]|nr:HAMP domain-containing protein [Oligoflexales bacterium]